MGGPVSYRLEESALRPERFIPIRTKRPLAIWGGVECTINRVRDKFLDQLALSGHRERVEADIESFAGLGLRTLRVGLHWEYFSRTGSWEWFDTLLGHLQRCGIEPIVGLLHHGSGPSSTSLLDPQFPKRFAEYALEVARRYPHVLEYTPINEPQTTGRFSCLYGHWYPHERNMTCYVRALTNQIKAIGLAMEAIRSVQPAAGFVHTEDGGETFSTVALEEERRKREQRRWLGTDLLCGRVDQTHPLFQFLLRHGLSEQEVRWFLEHPSPPSILGLNYYVTSDRFLDDRLELYPAYFPGGDTGAEPLVDFEAVRVRREGIAGAGAVLRQAWERYHLPVAITEAHLGCDAEDQMRWLAEVWQEASEAQAAGVDVRAVTVWALLGSYDWSNLCTRETGSYEAGAFEVRNGERVATPLAGLVRRLAAGEDAPPASLDGAGWWRSRDRFTVPAL